MRVSIGLLVTCSAAALLAAPRAAAGATAHPGVSAPTFAVTQLAHSDGGTEPRVAVGPDDHSWLITNQKGIAVVYGSTDGIHWNQTASDPAGQVAPSIDVDVVATRTGRIIATELDFDGPALVTSYSDDGGRTWTESTKLSGAPSDGTQYADQDRPWLAVGPDDPTTHQPRVYMLFHNLASGAASHNMFVATSNDGGASFGPPVPLTLPGSQAWLDLQCADSGGPSGLMVNQVSGQVYAVWGTRSSALAGGCGASVTGSFEINVVAATRIWVATAAASDTATAPKWTASQAVDDNASGRIVGMQLAPGALDSAGGVYVVYPESPRAYPDYSGAAIRYVHAPPDLSSWSRPVTVAAEGGAGHLLPHIVAGDPGKLDIAYFTGVIGADGDTRWYATAAQTLDGLSGAPHIAERRLSNVVTYDHWTASEMMGACGSGAAQGVQNGFGCPRSTDVWGVALDGGCRFEVTWPVTAAVPGAMVEGTYVATQVGGSRVCAHPLGVRAVGKGRAVSAGSGAGGSVDTGTGTGAIAEMVAGAVGSPWHW